MSILIDQCIAGNRMAQLQVYNKYSTGMYNVSHRIVNDSALAEDVMQESFVSAFAKAHTWSRTVTFGAWLKRIVVNNSLSELRKNKNVSFESYDAQLHDESEQDGIHDEAITGSTEAQRALAAINSLGDPTRTIMNLYLVEGYDHDEIVEITGVSHASSRTILSRGKNKIRKLLS